ncbi:PepSY-associated TM helix domain-containing protein [Pelagicoccus sp. SDUM812003]|uniref:PepSY-associated TM helix domain-containing protein n=1 Tax=Pelagicoccus sp. SDUM812003 TaxID=3041267 RepID=UPI00280CA144|nr:PepSY-associated TM helix domain-containing protein [Pelagicoccus sp. SDUM812003]MDQ8202928.1 PepSY-associated TM helix domain-containing protein [Pelagicoccus sp. SDUM812003]
MKTSLKSNLTFGLVFLSLTILRLILIKLHLYLGLVGGALLSVIAITGALYAYEPQLRAWWSEKIEAWTPASVLSPRELNETVWSWGVDGAATAYRWPEDDQAPVWVIWRTEQGERLDFMLDPSTGQRLPRAEAARVFFHGVLDIHRTLTMGEAGTKIVGGASAALLVLTISGLFIGVRRWRDAKRVWIPARSESRSRHPSVRWRFLHRIVGAWGTPWLLLMPLTGMVWSFDTYSAFLKQLGGPPQFPAYPTLQASGEGDAAVDLDRIWENCLTKVPQQTAMRLMLPTSPSQPARFEWSPEAAVSFAMRSKLFLDPKTGYVIEQHPWEAFSSGEQLVRWAYPLHTGRIAGVFGQTVAFLGALTMPFFFGTGLYLYLARRRKRRASELRTAK